MAAYRVWEKFLEDSLVKTIFEKIRESFAEKVVKLIARQTVRAVGVVFQHDALELYKALNNYLLVVGTVEEAANVSTLCRCPQVNKGQELKTTIQFKINFPPKGISHLTEFQSSTAIQIYLMEKVSHFFNPSKVSDRQPTSKLIERNGPTPTTGALVRNHSEWTLQYLLGTIRVEIGEAVLKKFQALPDQCLQGIVFQTSLVEVSSNHCRFDILKCGALISEICNSSNSKIKFKKPRTGHP